MTKNWSFAKITDILQKKFRSVIVSKNHYLNNILDVHPLLLAAVVYFNCGDFLKIFLIMTFGGVNITFKRCG